MVANDNDVVLHAIIRDRLKGSSDKVNELCGFVYDLADDIQDWSARTQDEALRAEMLDAINDIVALLQAT
jgi:hypothetical protein